MTAIDRDQFFEQLEAATSDVKNWPDWKKYAFDNSFKAFNRKPRKPVVSSKTNSNNASHAKTVADAQVSNG
jgi:hypothetical protein